LMFHNCPEFFLKNYSIQELGAIAVSMNYRFVSRETVCQAPHSEAVAFIYEEIKMQIKHMKGYYKEENKASEVIKNGWFYSSDLGWIDDEGDIRVAERKNECISTGGEKIFPREVEEILAEHEKIQDLCVIGVPDETWGNSVGVVIHLNHGDSATEQEIIDWCRGKMAGYKKPRTVMFVDELPISAVGKVQRNRVRELYGAPSPISEANISEEKISSELTE